MVAVIPRRRNALSATGWTWPQKKREIETRISPDVYLLGGLDGGFDPLGIDRPDQLAPVHERHVALLSSTSRPRRRRLPTGRLRR